MASKPAAGTILVTAVDSASRAAAVFRVTPKTGTATKVFAGGDLATPVGIAIEGPLDIAVEAKGDIVVADSEAFGGTGGIIRIDPRTGKQSKVASGGKVLGPRSVAVVGAKK